MVTLLFWLLGVASITETSSQTVDSGQEEDTRWSEVSSNVFFWLLITLFSSFPWGSHSLQATPVNFKALDADQFTRGRFFFFFFLSCLEFVLHHGKPKFIGLSVKFPAERSKFLFCTTAWSNDNRLFYRQVFFKGVYWCLLVTLSGKV